MGKSNVILRAIATCALKMSLPGMLVSIVDAADSIRRDLEAESKESQRRDELQEILVASNEQMRSFVRECVQEVAADQTDSIRRQIEAYLFSVQAQARRTMRRPSDPSGTTIPDSVGLRSPEEYVRLLPPKTPGFKPGDRPVSGVDIVLVELLGIGGYGEVWKVWSEQDGKSGYSALKICLDTKSSRSIRRESRLIQRVMSDTSGHPGFVRMLGSYLENDPPCLEYEYLEGGDLASVFDSWKNARTSLSPDKAAKIMRRLSEIVSVIHRLDPPIVHRDLKPANILLVRKDEKRVDFKIADLGIGGIVAEEAVEQYRLDQSLGRSATLAHQGSYTPLYASQEQINGDAADPRDDVHALGVIWYQMLKGNPSLKAPSGLAWTKEFENKGMPPSHVDLLVSCIEARAADRPRNAAEVFERLNSSPSLTWMLASKPPAVPSSLPPRKRFPQYIDPSKKFKVFLVGTDAYSDNKVRYIVKVLRKGGESAKVYDICTKKRVRDINQAQGSKDWNDFFEKVGHQAPWKPINENLEIEWARYGEELVRQLQTSGLRSEC